MKKIITVLSGIIVLLLIVIFYLPGNSTHPTTPTEKQTISIGIIGPLSGDPAVLGIQQKNALAVAFDELSLDDRFNSFNFNVIFEDSKCSGKDAHTAVTKLIATNNVSYILGGICSSETLGAAELFDMYSVIDLSWGSSPDISALGPYVFRNSPSDAVAGPKLARQVYDDGYSHIATLIGKTDFTDAFTDTFSKEYIALGGIINVAEVVDPEEHDFRTPIIKIKDSDAQAIFVLNNDPTSIGIMVKQIRELNLTEQIYSAYAFEQPAALEAAGEKNARGIIYVNAPTLDSGNETAQDFLQKYINRYGEEPAANQFYAAAAYDGAYIIAQTIQECGTDTACAQAYLHSLTYSGALGTYSFDENGDVIGIDYTIEEVK